LEAQKKLSIEIDLSKDVVFPFINMIQHDTNILEFVVKENGADADLSKIGRIVVYYRRRDKEEIPRFLKAVGNKINYKIGYQEMKLFGEGQIELQFYSLDNLSRVSTKRFKIYLSGSSGTDLVIENDKDLTLLQELFLEVSDLKTLAAQATDIVESEAERIENEEFRLANEDTRISNESSRVSAESLRNTAEATRYTQEDARKQAEVIREEHEDTRLENETIRQSAESTRSNSEETRQTKENERLTNETHRVSAESTRQSNEANRQFNEGTRSNNEVQRVIDENARKSAETSRINAETIRNDNEVIRQQQEESRQVTIQQAVVATENANVAANDAMINSANAKEQAEKAMQAAETARTYWLGPVANFAAIATVYPLATEGAQVITIDDQKQYRKINGVWQWTGIYSSNGVTALQAQLADANRQTQNLTHGTSIFASALNSPVEFEIQGRTLISLGNSNLEGNKNYVLSGKNFKIRAEGREGTLINGVAKFTKSASLITKADFVGKVSGSVAENANVGKRSTGGVTTNWNTLQTPSYPNFVELAANEYTAINSLNSSVNVNANSNNGGYAQQLFSFNIIEQIERKLGRIPSDTVAGKVAWIKENVQRLTANWHGWGSSVGGNGVSFTRWLFGSSKWDDSIPGTVSHTSGIVSKLAINSVSALIQMVDVNGLVHFLAHTTQPSDGTTPSQLNTDFIELECELKSTAVLDTRPIVTRTATFEGKVPNSLVENPHIAKYSGGLSVISPTGGAEFGTSDYNGFKTLDGVRGPVSTLTLNGIAQALFSFNLIEEIERNIGRIPKSTVADKVQWLKDNVDVVRCEWNGFGSSVGGNMASIKPWALGAWQGAVTTTSATVAKLVQQFNITNYIQSDGFIHFLAYAEPSDGTTASTISTDFISLDITLKQGAPLHDPILPLYEVDATEYANILVSWDESNVLNRYPRVLGVQHLQSLAVIGEGENLLPPFYEWTLHANATVKSPYEIELNATGAVQTTDFYIPVIGGQTYALNIAHNGQLFIDSTDGNKVQITRHVSTGTAQTYSVTTSTNAKYLRVILGNGTSGKFTFTNPMLTLGSTPKPHVPRNPSALFAPVKLGQIGDKKDSLFKSDGQWQVVERVKKDLVLDGSLGWVFSSNNTGYKNVTLSNYPAMSNRTTAPNLQKFDGKLLKYGSPSTDGSDVISFFQWGQGNLLFSISNQDTGFGETYNPNAQELSAFFNGWQAKTTDGNGKPTSWRSLGDGTDAPTQTLAYVSTNKAPNFTPYKLSYVLANPQTVNVNHLVEGDIVVSGPTQVEVTSGVIVREKVTPVLAGDNMYKVNFPVLGNSLKQKTGKLLTMHKNSLKDTLWTIYNSTAANGTQAAMIAPKDYDTNATYEVTYLVLDRHLNTVNATEIKASYSGSLKDTVDMNNEKLSDVATQTSINTNLIYRLLLQAKANNWSV
jgi:hypothetical protein